MSMNPAASDEFREQLSAWHDGALPDEASRFVLRRLLAEEPLRAEVGRWQVVGDVLRRERQQAPSSDVASRVAAALQAEGVAAVAPSRRAPALRLMATAAAVGVAAVLLWPSASPEAPGVEPLVASALPTPTAPRPIVTAAVAPRRENPAPLMAVAARAPDPLIARVPPLVRAPQPTPEQLAPLPAVDAPSRPWPRSASGDAAYTVDYAAPAAAPPRQ